MQLFFRERRPLYLNRLSYRLLLPSLQISLKLLAYTAPTDQAHISLTSWRAALEIMDASTYKLTDFITIYLTVIRSIYAALAVVPPFHYYICCKDQLKPHGVISKSVAIKGIVFLTFLQSIRDP